MKFRFHRGGFEESMMTAVEVSSMAELQAIIQQHYADSLHPPSNIMFEYNTFDYRNKWDTWYVMGEFEDGVRYPIGMSDAGSFD